MVARASNSSAPEAEAGLLPVWSLTGLQRKLPSQENNKTNNQEKLLEARLTGTRSDRWGMILRKVWTKKRNTLDAYEITGSSNPRVLEYTPVYNTPQITTNRLDLGWPANSSWLGAWSCSQAPNSRILHHTRLIILSASTGPSPLRLHQPRTAEHKAWDGS